ncbi:MAG: dienelactone hydrolase family protein [Planctomycetes bacterium]|nr:dienelactone hydrolase family protein [Planctomycetota bacterium]
MSDSNWINLKASDGTTCDAYVAAPKGPSKTGRLIVVCQEIFGVNRHIQSVCHRIAAKGWCAVAPDLYHRTVNRLELGYDAAAVAEGRKHKDASTPAGWAADINACIDYFAVDKFWRAKSVGVVGFCHGGHVAFFAGTLPRVKACACLYGGGIGNPRPDGSPPTADLAPMLKARMLMLYGGKDASIPLSQVEYVRAKLVQAKVKHEVVIYPDAEHGFACDERPSFNQTASDDAWKRTFELFEAAL